MELSFSHQQQVENLNPNLFLTAQTLEHLGSSRKLMQLLRTRVITLQLQQKNKSAQTAVIQEKDERLDLGMKAISVSWPYQGLAMLPP